MAAFHTGGDGHGGDALAQLLSSQGCRVVASLPELAASVPLYLLDANDAARTPRLAVISNSGASCVLAADACDGQGVPLAPLEDDTRGELDALLPPFSRSRNPVDLTAMLLADSGMFGRSVAALLRDATCDALALSLLAVAGKGYDVARFAADAAAAMRAHRKPVAFSSPDPRVRAAFAAEGIAVFASEWQAVEALKGAAQRFA